MVLADSFYYQPVQIDTINTRVNADLFAKEGDANGRGILVQITENGIIKDTSGITLRLQWSHVSVGVSGFTDFEVVDATKGLYKVQYPISMLHRGRVEAFIRITDNGILSGTRNLLITVERMVGSDETIEASDDFSALQSALTKLNIWEAAISGKVDTWESDMEATKQLYIDTLAAAEAAYPQELVSLQGQLADIEFVNKANRFRLNNVLGGKCVGHRGCGYAPENTMAAFEIAKKMGFKAVETDVLVTSDGVLVIHHDDTVDRMTNGTGTVSAMTLAQIKALNIDSGTNVTAFPTQKIPTFEELLAWLKANDMGLLLEFKAIFNAQNTLNIYNLLKKYNMLDKTILISFHLSALEAMRAIDPIIPLGYLRNGDVLQGDIDAAKAGLGSHFGISPYLSATTQNGVDLAHANDLFVIIWDVNTVRNAQTAIKTQSADYITTDTISEAVYYGTI